MSQGCSYTPDIFRWSGRVYQPTDLLQNLGHVLPFLVTVKQEQARKHRDNQMLWVCGTLKIPKVAVQDTKGTSYSIPEEYGAGVIPVHNANTGEPITMRELLCQSDDDLHFQIIVPLDTDDQSRSQQPNDLGLLKVMDTYTDKFLVVHGVKQGMLESEAQLLPMNSPISMSVALTVLEGGESRYFKAMMNLQDECDTFSKDYSEATANWTHIRVFDETPNLGNYDRLPTCPIVTVPPKHQDSTAPPNDQDSPLYHNFLEPGAEQEDEGDYQEPCISLSIAHGIDPAQQLKRLRLCLSSGAVPATELVKKTPRTTLIPVKRSQTSVTSKSKATIRYSVPSGGEVSSAKGVSSAKDDNMYDFGIYHLPDVPPKYFDYKADTERRVRFPYESYSCSEESQKSQTYDNIANPPDPFDDVNPQRSQSESSQSHTRIPQHRNERISADVTTSNDQASSFECDFDLDSIPGDISGLTVNEVARCLQLLHLDKHSEEFRDKLVDGELLATVMNNEKLLQTDFGFQMFEAKKLMKFIQGWRPST